MAQNIQLTDRVRYFPTKTKADILPRLGAKFIATVIFNASNTGVNEEVELPQNFANWQEDGNLNYPQIVGFRNDIGEGYGLISEIDWNIFYNYGLDGYALNIMNKSYYVYYGDSVNPETGLNSGFMLYDVYNVQPYPTISAANSSKVFSFISVDIYESTELINTAKNYSDIGQ
jgi:hypothetical protein